MINIGALAIFFLTFTTINSINPLCLNNPRCKCLLINSDLVKIFCNFNSSSRFIFTIRSSDYLQILCENWEGWKDFNFTNNPPGKIINSLQFKYCGISDEISLIDMIKQIGLEEINTLVFESIPKFGKTLEKKPFRGFSNVTKLILSSTNLCNISKDLFLDFPKLEWLELSYNTIDLPVDIFDAIPNLKQLELIENKMKVINIGTFYKLKNLEILNLNGNKLIEINDRIFDGLVSLKFLFLNKNYLRILPRTIFYRLRKLEILDISYNNFSSMHSELFDQNKELRQLLLHNSNTKMTTLPDKFLSNLKMLERVLLYMNGFTVLPENIFWNSLSLKYINLNSNYLKTLPQNIFKYLKKIKSLEINNNLIETLPDGIFKDMSNLEELDLSGNKMVSVTKDLFKGLTNLIKLNMERNQLKYIDETSLSSIKHLNIARFSHNQLKFNTTTTKWSPFYNNQFLNELHLSNNSITHFFSDWFILKYHLRLLNLSHNNITTLSTGNFSVPSEEIQIDVRYNKIKNILFNYTEILESLMYVKPNVTIFVEHNPLLCDCNLYYFLIFRENNMHFSAYHIKIVLGNLTCIQPNGINEIKISQLHSSTYTCPEDDYFNIEQNCQIGCNCIVRPSDDTRIIDCSYKNMSEFTIDQKKVNYMGKYPLVLNLTGNFLTEMPSIKPLQVTDLLLSDNCISQIRTDELPDNLTVLELHNNNISVIGLDLLGYLNITFLDKFTISGNPIKCDCDNEDLFKFVQLNYYFYEDLDKLKCDNDVTLLYTMTVEQLCFKIDLHTFNVLGLCLFGSFISAAIISAFYKYVIKRLDTTPREDTTEGEEMIVQYSAVDPEVVNITEQPREVSMIEQLEEVYMSEESEELNMTEESEEADLTDIIEEFEEVNMRSRSI